jgi:hypothetical protein
MLSSTTDQRLAVIRLMVIAISGAFAIALTAGYLSVFGNPRKTVLGSIVEATELSSGLTFSARVDTGAAISSIHCEQIEIPNESEDPRLNINKIARVMLMDETGNQRWVTAKLVDYTRIRNVDATHYRYCVKLTLSCQGVAKETPVSLKDRNHMAYRLLLGREFLRDDFLVDVARDSSVLR